MRARTAATVAAAPYCSAAEAGRRESFSIRAWPATVSASMRKPLSSSVRRMSWPLSTSGPVPMEVQKQVEAAFVHWTATMKTLARRAA